jgi:hypothetical protein
MPVLFGFNPSQLYHFLSFIISPSACWFVLVLAKFIYNLIYIFSRSSTLALKDKTLEEA